MTVRVGFLGAGLIASLHAGGLQHAIGRDGLDVAFAGVFDVDASRADAFAGRTGATVAASEEAVFDSCDAVYVCTWTSEHERLVDEAARRGLAVFCEKPLSIDLAGATRMTAAVEAAGIVNQVGLVLRRSPAFKLLVHLVSQPESGRLLGVHFRDDQYLPVQGMYGSTWRADVARAGAGVLMEHSIHDVDLIDWISGGIESVRASVGTVHGIDGIEDVASVTFDLGAGASGTLFTVWHDILERPSTRRCEVFCERAMFTVDNDWWGPLGWQRTGGETAQLEGRELVRAVPPADRARGHNPDAAFVEAVRTRTPAFPDFRTALRAHTIVDACYRSAAGGGEAVPAART
jgi:myo-inositol 2-dehydrogenase / D-chiro-inositol 1-dehydrogenase